jgi:hypothetical protein
MAPDFSKCGELYRNASSHTPNPYDQWKYNGPIRGVLRATDTLALITVEGCYELCGRGMQTYEWTAASNTITTWVLPVVGGLLLQAPFESNRFWRTFFALIRWMGSPMSSLSYVLWNIKVTGKCALMVDMAVPFNQVPWDENSEFSQMRDAFYILAVMNQYEIKSRMPEIPAEKLLRIALFSDSLKLTHNQDDTQSLPKLRKALAHDLRRGRRRGTVPVFISIGWFLFSLGISVESAFGNLGENATAHNLALGVMLGWIPVFILGSIIDRNPISSDDIRLRLNDLLDSVRRALLDPELRDTYIRDTGRAPDDYKWTQALDNHEYFSASFFSDFAGQGRTRWHYGVAHPILAGIERAYVANYGRDWLANSQRARTAMVIGPEQLTGLRWFDWREIWQILSAVSIVLGTVMGAFIISYWTPTVGLGCRSGGYMIFLVIAFTSLVIEMLLWWSTPSRRSGEAPGWLQKAAIGDPLMKVGSRLERWLSRSHTHSWQPSLGRKMQDWMRAWENLQFRSKMEILVLKPMDFINTAWLIYIVNAQTFGWYRTCSCMASVWGGGGGYIDFESIVSYKAHGISLYWGSGTALSLVVITTALLFIIAEWCSQSHLSTMNYEAASRGLKRTRSWKQHTVLLRRAPNAIIEGVVVISWAIIALFSDRKQMKRGRRSLIWSAKTKHLRRPPPIVLHRAAHSETDDEEDFQLLNLARSLSDDLSLRSISAPSPSHLRVSPSGASTDYESYWECEPTATFGATDL